MSTSDPDPLPGFDDRAPRDRYCDLILTGGVTSSIAYPAAIFVLARAYRFNSIGGSSSGAGAAALAAAAEYRRRHGSSHGFRILIERTAEVADMVEGKTRLAWLFQPDAQNRRLFNALLRGFARPKGRTAALVGGLLRAYGVWIGPVVLIAVALTYFSLGEINPALLEGGRAYLVGIAATALFLLVALVVLAIMAGRDIVHMMRNNYGLCSGLSSQDAPCPPLTEWLHALIQEIAGRGIDEKPLTFADLADAPGSPGETLNDPSPMGAISINLQMFTANVTHGRPYVFPQKEGTEMDSDPPLYFRESEMRRLFPFSVVQHMMHDPVTGQRVRPTALKAVPSEEVPANWPWSLMGKPKDSGEQLYPLPRKHLPILVAARMSVSFPILFSAVPLWTLDERKRKPEVLRRCHFCDGGLCSAFPIHLFDSPVPSWPTFGIAIHDLPPREHAKEQDVRWFSQTDQSTHEDAEYGVVWLPQTHQEGKDDFWDEFETERSPIKRFAAFIGALLSTTQKWNDATLARLPGVRERVLRIGLRPGIGGLNILMSEPQIRGLADLGERAGLMLLKRFALPVPRQDGSLSHGWNEHRWVRLNVLRDSLANLLSGMSWASSQAGHGRPLAALIRQAGDESVLAGNGSSQLLAAQEAALNGALSALMQAERALNAPTVEQPYKPSPRPVMRVRPPF